MMRVKRQTEMTEGGSVLKQKRVFLLPVAVSPALLPSRTEESGERGRGGEAEGRGLGEGGSRTTYLRHLSK